MTHMIRIVLLTSAIVTGFAATQPATAAGGARGERPAFSEIDANGDGALTRDEMQSFGRARAQARLAAADTNGDGTLTRAELTAVGDARQSRRLDGLFERHDANGDGALDQAELRTVADSGPGDRGDRLFGRADTDGNGTISAEEYSRIGAGLRARRQ
ncbi:MAG: EF-hand domain-containing protein [Pseudomonadota bacterium]